MRLASTGLGKAELEAEVIDINRVDDVLIFYVNTTKPVKWRTRMVFPEKDIRYLLSTFVKPKNLWFIIRSFFSDEKKVARTERI